MIDPHDLTQQKKVYARNGKGRWAVLGYCPSPSVTMLCLETGERLHFGLPGSMNVEFSPIEGDTCGPDERYAAAQRKCEWKADDDGTYWTSCGQAFVFNDDGPKENGMKFCPYCGAELVTPNLEVTGAAPEKGER